MKDIASELDVSITTVSFVVNGKSQERGISAATTKKIKDLIKKKGFNPNSAARILRTGKSKTLGLIVEDISNYFFGNVAKIIEMEAHKNGYNIFFSSTDGDNETARALINKMKNSSVDGLIITATNGIKDEILQLKKDNLPFVLFDRLVPGVEGNSVILDNYKGAYDLTKHLLDNGYKKIGFVTICSGMSQMIDRKKGFIDAMEDSQLKIAAGLILELPFNDNKAAVQKIKEYLSGNPQLDALFFATNYLGVLGIEALQQNNLRIPDDIAVVSFDDNDLFRLMNPSITVAAQPITELASKSIEILLKLINKDQKQIKVIKEIIEPLIIIRNSSPVKMVKEPA